MNEKTKKMYVLEMVLYPYGTTHIIIATNDRKKAEKLCAEKTDVSKQKYVTIENTKKVTLNWLENLYDAGGTIFNEKGKEMEWKEVKKLYED